MQKIIKVHISVISNDGTKDKHVAIDIDKADELMKHPGLSDDADAFLSVLGKIVAEHEDSHKIFISPKSEADPEQTTYLLKTA